MFQQWYFRLNLNFRNRSIQAVVKFKINQVFEFRIQNFLYVFRCLLWKNIFENSSFSILQNSKLNQYQSKGYQTSKLCYCASIHTLALHIQLLYKYQCIDMLLILFKLKILPIRLSNIFLLS